MELMDEDGSSSFLEELMAPLRRGTPSAPEDLWQAYPMSPMCGGGGRVMLGDLLVGSDARNTHASPPPSFPLPVALTPPPPRCPPLHVEIGFEFDCLGEVCNPYKRSGGAVRAAADVAQLVVDMVLS
ncbi:hypothetical protein E2562_006013 [Oryza meyeriana var. granulata]|uniref:Uncharacterized protein n=1 Tax=Oryza meyeriana var. granulata TaxID=110450 RepID=A0A6G1EVA7_9ORYZ|nr:hypothetical protein E2562_006013 [Oryza meyeriana var. granulata]